VVATLDCGMTRTESTASQHENTLLDLLPEKSRRDLPPAERVVLHPGMVLHEPDEQIDYVYFLSDALVSILSLGPDGATVEISLIGRHGMVGVPAILGGVTPYKAVVQTGGEALRMKCGPLSEDTYSRNKAFQTLLLKYTNTFLIQVAQSSLCNCYHPLQERICRWLMVASDGARTDTIRVTHDTIARLLGTRRASVTSTAGLLQKAGLIRMSRGQIRILDPEGLRNSCCECYLILREGIRQLTLS
jgi:CRP-like cAMP-binding protein